VTDPVYAAVGGVIVGALASGSVQSYLSRSDRRRDGRHAARVLYMEMYEAEATIRELRARRDWRAMITDWDSFGSAWSQYRDQVTHVLNTKSFAYVDSGFASMASLSRARQRDLAEPLPAPGAPPRFDPPDDILGIYLHTAQRAKRIVLKASLRWWEIWARRKALAE